MSFCIISRVLLCVCVCVFVHVAFVRIKLMMMIVHRNLKPHKFLEFCLKCPLEISTFSLPSF